VRKVRIAAHVHSEWSYDAEWPLAALAEQFARRGYDAVLTAEHDVGFDGRRWDEYRAACAAASRPDLLIVPGMEYQDADSTVHVPVWGVDLAFLGSGRPTLELLREAHSAGGFTVFAHPGRRNALARFDQGWLPYLDAVEVWNRHYDGIAPHPTGFALAREHGLAPFCSLDFHTRRQFFPLALGLEIDAPLSAASVVEALHARRFRAEAFGRPASQFAGGIAGPAAQQAERLRRVLRGPLRRIERTLRR
jgi:predicted metal-dependent phosphoesterase TrpH